MFAAKSCRDAPMADIAKRLRIGHGTLYRYFESKLNIVRVWELARRRST